MNDIYNYHEFNDQVATGGQPEENHFRLLKEKGFEAIVNISPTSTKNYLASKAELSEKMKFDYIHYPIDCGNLQQQHFKTFSSVLKSLQGKKVFVHCGGNIKSSNLVHMYQVLEQNIKEEDSLETLKAIQEPELKWLKYFRQMGMQGLN